MSLERVFEILDIEEIEDFKYFDNLSALLESDENIDYEDIYYIISHVDENLFADLLDDYFEDLMGSVPEGEDELYMLFDSIHRSMSGLAKNVEEDNSLVILAEEIVKFRNWYCFDTDVVCTKSGSGEKTIHRVRDALVLHRLEKLHGDAYSYDFSECMNYEIDEYIVSLGVEDTDDYDYMPGREEEALLNSDYLFDDAQSYEQ